MGTAVISGRVDESVKERAARYIQAAGLTVGDVIKTVWESIAQTGEVPRPVDIKTDVTTHSKHLEALACARARIAACPELLLMDDAQMRACVAERYEEDLSEARDGA